MSADLKNQIRRYAHDVESRQTPVSVTEARVRANDLDDVVVGLDLGSKRKWGPRGAWPALAAAVVALALFGLLVWVLPGREPSPPVDTAAPVNIPTTSEFAYLATSTAPEGFMVQDLWPFGGGRVLYLAESGDTWLPTDGGFSVNDLITVARPGTDPESFVEEVLTATPAAEPVSVADRPGVLLEAVLSQDGTTTPIIWVLGIDEDGYLFEVCAVGMTREDVLQAANGVQRLSVEGSIALGTAITWDIKIDATADGFSLDVPPMIDDAATSVQVAIGTDLLQPRLAHTGMGATVVTTDTGEVVETSGETIKARAADLFLRVPEERIDDILAEYPGQADLSPLQSQRRVDRYLTEVVDQVLSDESPTVLQAGLGPEPSFDTAELGQELPLVPSTSIDDIPAFALESRGAEAAAASPGRLLVIIGSVEQPDSAMDTSVIALVWSNATGVVCEGSGDGESMGSGCGLVLRPVLGLRGGSSGSGVDDIRYAVPLETSAVQIVTNSGSYWQRPRGGYGVISYDDTVGRPQTLIAFGADGNEIGRWENGSGLSRPPGR